MMAAMQDGYQPTPPGPTGSARIYDQRLQQHHEPVNGPPSFGGPVAPTFGLSVMGAHGGAGASTLARLLNAVDTGPLWPNPGRCVPWYVLVAARTNAAGLDAASRVLASYRARRYPQGCVLLGFVLMADAPGRIPKPISRSVTILSSAVPVTRVPWVGSWRLGEITSYEQELAGGLRQFIDNARTRMGGFTCVAS
jgi:hypothetical protein